MFPWPRTRTRTRRRPSPHKQRRIPLGVVRPQGAMLPPMTLRDMLTPTISSMLIIMGMYMLNTLALMMVTLLMPFGFPRPLLLTKADPLQNGYLKASNDF